MAKGTLPLDPSWTKRWDGRKEGEKNKEKKKVERERLYLLSRFPGDLTISFRRSKRESVSSQRELQIETGIGEF